MNELLPRLAREAHTATAMGLAIRAGTADRGRWAASEAESYQVASKVSLEEALSAVRSRYPHLFEMWRQRLDMVEAASKASKIGNLAHAGDLYSRMFKSFVEIYAQGRVLDVGCGNWGRPYYLEAYPPELISGIDPLPMNAAVDFEFTRGINEILPWPDAAFSTVISATSLDHTLSLDGALAEIRRVLRPGGTLILWVGSIPGAPPYEPTSASFVPADQYHLFHFDCAWLDPLLAKSFRTLESLEFTTPSFSHVFYALRPVQS